MRRTKYRGADERPRGEMALMLRIAVDLCMPQQVVCSPSAPSHVPAELLDAGILIHNCDESIDVQVRELVTAGTHFGALSGWNQWGVIWTCAGVWKGEVWVHHQIKEVMEAPTLLALRDRINDKYGWD